MVNQTWVQLVGLISFSVAACGGDVDPSVGSAAPDHQPGPGPGPQCALDTDGPVLDLLRFPDGTVAALVGSDPAHLVLLNDETGQVRAEVDLDTQVDRFTPFVMLQDQVVVGGDDSFVYAFDALGDLRWSARAQGHVRFMRVVEGSRLLALDQYGLLYEASVRGQWDLDPSLATQLPAQVILGFDAAADGSIAISVSGAVYLFGPDGELHDVRALDRWSEAFPAMLHFAPTGLLVGDTLGRVVQLSGPETDPVDRLELQAYTVYGFVPLQGGRAGVMFSNLHSRFGWIEADGSARAFPPRSIVGHPVHLSDRWFVTDSAEVVTIGADGPSRAVVLSTQDANRVLELDANRLIVAHDSGISAYSLSDDY